jgi:hypothetical protein
MSAFTGRPWAEMRKGKAIDESWLAQQLRPYGIQPKNIWIDGTQAKGYLREDFIDAFRRYIPRSEVQSLLGQPPPAEPPSSSA